MLAYQYTIIAPFPFMHTSTPTPGPPRDLTWQDVSFFKTVHSGGTGRAKEEAEDKAREKAEWKAKVCGGGDGRKG